MIKVEKPIRLFLWSVLLLLLLSGCAGSVKNMSPMSEAEALSPIEEGKAKIVFMRPSSLGFAIQSSVFEIKGGKPALVGIVAAKKKVAYQLDPGEHLFMVVGESADFMSAELDANKTYYALVTPRMGMWKARFSLRPVHASELNTADFNDWFEECEWVTKNADTETWFSDNLDNIQSKQEEYYPEWMEKALADRPKLSPQDGK